MENHASGQSSLLGRLFLSNSHVWAWGSVFTHAETRIQRNMPSKTMSDHGESRLGAIFSFPTLLPLIIICDNTYYIFKCM